MNQSRPNTIRELVSRSAGMATSDGEGVRMRRFIGTPELNVLDPFLLLDVFESDQPEDYIGGFPNHPHRGFETVTYLLAGRMRHRDNAGNEGVIEPGGVQWMTAGRGIIHSEMPEQENGLLRGFQLWVNLPAHAKMSAPGYQEFPPGKTPLVQRADGTTIRVISGRTAEGIEGPVKNLHVNPTFMDITLPAATDFQQAVNANATAFLFMIDGQLSAGARRAGLDAGKMGILSPGNNVQVTAGPAGARFLLISGQALNEPIARGGPFVMNTRAEVQQAFDDYRNNRF